MCREHQRRCVSPPIFFRIFTLEEAIFLAFYVLLNRHKFLTVNEVTWAVCTAPMSAIIIRWITAL